MPRSTGKPGTVPSPTGDEASTGRDVPVIIRRAEVRDIHDIRRIDRLVYPTPWSGNLTLKEVTGSDRAHFVAELNHRVIGHGGLALLHDEGHITTLAVHPSHQRDGVGAALLAELIEAAAATNCTGVTLEVRAGNTSAIAFYEKSGFTSSGIRTGYYSDTGEDALIMWRSRTGDEPPAEGTSG